MFARLALARTALAHDNPGSPAQWPWLSGAVYRHIQAIARSPNYGAHVARFLRFWLVPLMVFGVSATLVVGVWAVTAGLHSATKGCPDNGHGCTPNWVFNLVLPTAIPTVAAFQWSVSREIRRSRSLGEPPEGSGTVNASGEPERR